jgi:signal transduction histidine kinase
VNERLRARLPWAIWLSVTALLAATLILSAVNDSLHGDVIFIGVAILMIIGYTTVGAILASRIRGNPIGWLMMLTGAGFLLSAFSSEYTKWAFVTSPGHHPFVNLALVFDNVSFIVAIAPIPLLLILFPNGRVPSSRWRWLPPAIVITFSIGTVGSILRTGPVGGVPGIGPPNPTGISSLRTFLNVLLPIIGVAGIVFSLLSVVVLVQRFRAARGEERQQIRWLAYVAVLATVFFVLAFVSGIGLKQGQSSTLNDVMFIAFFTCLGIGVPAATGVAVLRYRLWDLDIVVKKTVVFAIVAAVITTIYVTVLLAIPTLVFGANKSFSPLVFGTTVAIAILFAPLRARARRLADRLVYGRRATPYEVLSEFSDRLSGSYSTEDVLPRMAQLVRAGTGATRAVVWLRVGDDLVPAATAPADSDRPLPIRQAGEELSIFPEPASAFPVRHQGELLGAISLDLPPSDPITADKERLVLDVAAQAGLVLRNVRLIEELRASRRRIVAAQDERARKLERDIHDGAQQQLVALSVQLKLAEQLVGKDPEKERELLRRLQTQSTNALEDLRDLAHGIYPPLLADQGLAAALEAQVRKASLPVTVGTDGIGRYPRDVEAAVYFCVLEALNNAAKYAGASGAKVQLKATDGWLMFEVSDDGLGFDPAGTRSGTGLRGMADRLDAVGGTLKIRSSPGAGTSILGEVPAFASAGYAAPDAADQAASSRSGPNTALGM